MKQEKVYVVATNGQNDGEFFHCILGVFANLEDAKLAMANDIKQIKKDWDNIDFVDPEEWECSQSELCYEGFTPSDDYQYSIDIQEMAIQ